METARSNRVCLTERDALLLTCLAQCVKVMSIEQAMAFWMTPADSSPAARRRLARLVRAGWLDLTPFVAAVPLPAVFPIAVWAVGGAQPSWPEVLASARARASATLRPIRLITASRQAALFVGGIARYSRPSEVTHDLRLTDVFLHFVRNRGPEACSWQGEALLGRKPGHGGTLVPDALIVRPGTPVAVEVVGESYTARKLAAFHECCSQRKWGYELW